MSLHIYQEPCVYRCADTQCRGLLSYGSSAGAHSAGLVLFHAWRGLDDFAGDAARSLSAQGYTVLAADLYGDGKTAHSDQEALELMTPLFLERSLLQERALAAFDALRVGGRCAPDKVGALGFCFGGLTAIELLRSGAAVRGCVSFHGVLGTTLNGREARRAPPAAKMLGALLVLHGHDDPLVEPADIAALQREMTDGGVDWQMHIYGHTSHAFTNPMAHDPAHGLCYQATSARRAWQAMDNFFNALLEG